MSKERISIQCPRCGRRVDGMLRADYDPPHATMFKTLCPNCAAGCKVDGGDYYDANGEWIDWFEWHTKQGLRA